VATSTVLSKEPQDRTPDPYPGRQPEDRVGDRVERVLYHIGLPAAANASRLDNARSSAPHPTERPTRVSAHSGSACVLTDPRRHASSCHLSVWRGRVTGTEVSVGGPRRRTNVSPSGADPARSDARYLRLDEDVLRAGMLAESSYTSSHVSIGADAPCRCEEPAF
jgi:hypothetical protein